MSKRKFVVGNWKMYKTIVEATSFVAGLSLVAVPSHVNVGLAVPFTMISAAAEAARGSSVLIGGQNVYDADEGAFTGEISSAMLKDAGASFVIVGHSERRRLFHEDSAWVNRKAKKALDKGLRVIICVGETLEQHQAGKAQEVVTTQLTESLKEIAQSYADQVAIAYEPVWAIGTNVAATPEDAQEMHALCRQILAGQWGESTAKNSIIQYGGSVKVENAAALMSQPDIDGLLVGGASLTLDSFIKIIHSCYS